jgi:hypothetical protein
MLHHLSMSEPADEAVDKLPLSIWQLVNFFWVPSYSAIDSWHRSVQPLSLSMRVCLSSTLLLSRLLCSSDAWTWAAVLGRLSSILWIIITCYDDSSDTAGQH